MIMDYKIIVLKPEKELGKAKEQLKKINEN